MCCRSVDVQFCDDMLLALVFTFSLLFLISSRIDLIYPNLDRSILERSGTHTNLEKVAVDTYRGTVCCEWLVLTRYMLLAGARTEK